MKKRIYMSVGLAAALALSGCGSSGSSSTEVKKSIEGTVYDPEIVNADVRLECENKNYYSRARTNAKGYFKIENIDANTKIEECMLISKGGKDGADNLEGLSLKAPMNMFDLEKEENIYITPITSMVANDDEVKTDIKKAKEKIARFLKIEDIEKLNDKPEGNIAKLAKKLTLIAMSRNKTSAEKIGFKSLDLDEINEDSIEKYLENEESISTEDKEALNSEFESIDLTNGSKEAILEVSVKREVRGLLKSAYKIKKENAKYEEYMKNIKSLTKKITESLKIEEGYKEPNRYVIRKALSDAELSVSLKSDNSLTDDIYEKITQEENAFNTFLTSKTLDVKNIKGITIYEVEKYAKVVGSDNNKRIEYYTFSDISNIAEALKVAQTSYDDNVLDPIYQKVANGYVALGFYNEAIEVAKENIYSDSIQIQTLLQIAQHLVKVSQNELAVSTLDSAFEKFKSYAKAIGETNISYDDSETLINITDTYNKINKAKRNLVVEYIDNKILNEKAKMANYKSFMYYFDVIIYDAVVKKNMEDYKYLVNYAYSFAKKVPTEGERSRDVIRNIFYVVPHLPYINEFAKAEELIAIARKVDEERLNKYNKDDVLAVEILKSKEKMNEVVKNFESYKDETGDVYKTRFGILVKGLAYALIQDNQMDKAIELITNNFNNKAYVDEKSMDKYPNVLLQYTKDFGLTLTRVLGLMNKENHTAFMYSIFKDSQNKEKAAWNFYRTAADYKDKNSDMVNALFGNASDLLGYSVFIRELTKNEEYAKAKEIIEYSIKYIDEEFVSYEYDDKEDGVANPNEYKIQAYLALLDAFEQSGYFDKTNENQLKETVVSRIKTLSTSITLNYSSSTYRDSLKKALKIINYLVKEEETAKAKEVVNILRKSIGETTDGKKSSIEKLVGYSVGVQESYRYSYRYRPSNAMLNAYITVQDFVGAKSLIDEALKKVDTLADSLDKNLLLVPIARAYAAINEKDLALAIVNRISTIKEKNEAKLNMSDALANFDSFPTTDVASIDTDGDGKPDFFSKLAKQDDIDKSKLNLDDDIDGDKTTDDVDKYPYSKDKN